MKLCLYTVNAFMDDSGMAWPSQLTISKSAGLSEKTVQRLLGGAIDAGWLGAVARPPRNYTYYAAIPDSLENCETMSADTIIKIMTGFDGPLLERGRPFKKQTISQGPSKPIVPSVDSTVPILNGERPLSEGCTVPILNGERPLSEGCTVPILNGEASPPRTVLSSHLKLPSEVSIEVTNEGAVFDSTTVFADSNSRMKAAEAAKADGERKAASDRERIRKAIRELPDDFSDADIAKVTKTDIADVQQVRNTPRSECAA
jgi:Helix-turn-helix domain